MAHVTDVERGDLGAAVEHVQPVAVPEQTDGYFGPGRVQVERFAAVGEPDRSLSGVPIRSPRDVQCRALQPHLAVVAAGQPAEEGKVGGVELRRDRTRRAVQVDRCGQPVLTGDLVGDVGGGGVAEGPGTPGHPQALQAVLGEHGELSHVARRILGLERAHLAGEYLPAL